MEITLSSKSVNKTNMQSFSKNKLIKQIENVQPFISFLTDILPNGTIDDQYDSFKTTTNKQNNTCPSPIKYK